MLFALRTERIENPSSPLAGGSDGGPIVLEQQVVGLSGRPTRAKRAAVVLMRIQTINATDWISRNAIGSLGRTRDISEV